MSQHGDILSRTVTEVGSGMTGNRPKLTRLLRDPNITVIVAERRARLARVGVEHLEVAPAARNRRIVVVEETDTSDALVGDVTEVLTSLCARR